MGSLLISEIFPSLSRIPNSPWIAISLKTAENSNPCKRLTLLAADHNGEEHIVRDDFERNVQLIDLTAQPLELKVKFVETIAENSVQKTKTGVGMNFLKFCGIHNLQNLAKSPDEIATILNKSYPNGIY